MSEVEVNGIATLPDEKEAAKIRRGKPFRKNGRVIDPGAVDRSVVAFQARKGSRRSVGAMFEAALARRMKLYRSDALDALHDLAMMPISSNFGQNMVKLQACRTLTGTVQEGHAAPEFDETLKALNEQYHLAATRIKSLRERVISFETSNAIAKD